MRPKERIPNFLEKVNWGTLAERWGIDLNTFKGFVIDGKLAVGLTTFWEKNPDLRFGKMLINFNLVPDKLRIWNDEEYDILKDQGFDDRDIIFWGRNYDKDHNLLPKTEWILIKNMSTDHIKAVLKDMEGKLAEIYETAFKNELKIRNELTNLT